mmetsp:Transcript_37685/g.96306  ORF Transcript_37685/g.96306 Transcript_37685/m.96306 type:complete len:520 (+) Transcript_37685:185-1744(+)
MRHDDLEEAHPKTRHGSDGVAVVFEDGVRDLLLGGVGNRLEDGVLGLGDIFVLPVKALSSPVPELLVGDLHHAVDDGCCLRPLDDGVLDLGRGRRGRRVALEEAARCCTGGGGRGAAALNNLDALAAQGEAHGGDGLHWVVGEAREVRLAPRLHVALRHARGRRARGRRARGRPERGGRVERRPRELELGLVGDIDDHALRDGLHASVPAKRIPHTRPQLPPGHAQPLCTADLYLALARGVGGLEHLVGPRGGSRRRCGLARRVDGPLDGAPHLRRNPVDSRRNALVGIRLRRSRRGIGVLLGFDAPSKLGFGQGSRPLNLGQHVAPLPADNLVGEGDLLVRLVERALVVEAARRARATQLDDACAKRTSPSHGAAEKKGLLALPAGVVPAPVGADEEALAAGRVALEKRLHVNPVLLLVLFRPLLPAALLLDSDPPDLALLHLCADLALGARHARDPVADAAVRLRLPLICHGPRSAATEHRKLLPLGAVNALALFVVRIRLVDALRLKLLAQVGLVL